MGDPPSFDNIMIGGTEITTLEGWLQMPSKQNIRRHGWKKLFVIVSSKKIIFFNSETERQNADPQLILDLNKVFHVRSVTQGDVIRAEAKDIPRIFQILYAGEGESVKPSEYAKPGFDDSTVSTGLGKGDRGDSTNVVNLKGHEFVAITFHIPAASFSNPSFFASQLASRLWTFPFLSFRFSYFPLFWLPCPVYPQRPLSPPHLHSRPRPPLLLVLIRETFCRIFSYPQEFS